MCQTGNASVPSLVGSTDANHCRVTSAAAGLSPGSDSKTGQIGTFTILPFCHFAFCHFAILSFCHSSIVLRASLRARAPVSDYVMSCWSARMVSMTAESCLSVIRSACTVAAWRSRVSVRGLIVLVCNKIRGRGRPENADRALRSATMYCATCATMYGVILACCANKRAKYAPVLLLQPLWRQ